MSAGTIGLLVAAGGTVAVLANAPRNNVPISKFGGYAALAFFGGLIVTITAYLLVPVLWLVIAVAPGTLAWWLSEHLGARNYKRRAEDLLLAARLKEVIPEWGGIRSLYVDWGKGVDKKGIAEVKVALPPKVLPGRVIPGVKTVIGETLGGTWSVETERTLLRVKRVTIVKDPAPIERLKTVLADRECFGDGGFTLGEWQLTADGTAVDRYALTYRNGSAFAKNKEKSKGVERVLSKRIPVPSGSWMFEWDLATTEMSAVRSAFERMMLTPKIEHFVTSRQEAIERYPDAGFRLGVYGDGSEVLWTPVAEGTPHCNTCGASGKGKTSWAHTLIAQAAALGWCVIIIDFKLSKSFRGFLDWPNVHLVCNSIYANIKAIYYVVELLNRRRENGGASSMISDDVPILVIMDEYAEFAMQMVKNVWPRFKQQGDPSIPPVLGEIDGLMIMAREFRIHLVTMLQKPSADFINPNVIFNSGKKFQVGNMPGAMSQVYWEDHGIGSSFPDVPGRGLVKDALSDNPAREFQAYYTPDPIKAHKPRDLAILSDLLPPVSLYPRVGFDMMSPFDLTQWDEIITAPLEVLDDRPDLDPLSPHYVRQPIFNYDTLGNLNPASMTVSS